MCDAPACRPPLIPARFSQSEPMWGQCEGNVSQDPDPVRIVDFPANHRMSEWILDRSTIAHIHSMNSIIVLSLFPALHINTPYVILSMHTTTPYVILSMHTTSVLPYANSYSATYSICYPLYAHYILPFSMHTTYFHMLIRMRQDTPYAICVSYILLMLIRMRQNRMRQIDAL